MRKNCVQHVDSVWKELCRSAVFTQRQLVDFAAVCKNCVQSPHYTQQIHSTFFKLQHLPSATLSYLSTKPIITTIFLYNKKQAGVAEGVL